MLRAVLWLGLGVSLVLFGIGLSPRHDSAGVALRPEVRFDRDVRPILAGACLKCHGRDERDRAAGLRLDTREGALAPLESGASAIVPGDSASSELIRRVTATDDAERMPPAEAHRQLTEREIEVLRNWIDAGAAWEGHWGFEAPRRSDAPPDPFGSWARDPVDRFIGARLAREGLRPAREAEPADLLRRVTFALTGLPPTLEEMVGFTSDPTDSEFERLVDRLLASEAYGERMASDWLDLARYADTYGYQSDVRREVWPWRDWVIDAFNSNLPYDEFIRWQLAGDLLPDATREQRLATTFNRLHRQTNEGGSIEEEFRIEYVADRTHTYGTAMLGLTLECARCHEHKYDPISQDEYYELFAYFNNIDESGLYSHFTSATPTPALELPTDEQSVRIRDLESQIQRLERALRELPDDGSFERWRAEGGSVEIPGLVGHFPFDEQVDDTSPNAVVPEGGATFFEGAALDDAHGRVAVRLNGDNGVRLNAVGHFTRADPFSLSLMLFVPESKERAVVLHRSRAWTDAGSQGYELLLLNGALSWSLIHFWPGDAIRILAADQFPVGRWARVTGTYDGSSRASGLAIYIDGVRADSEVVRDGLRRSITGGGPGDPTIGQRFRDRGLAGGHVDDVMVFNRALTAIEVRQLTHEHAIDSSLAEGGDELRDYYLSAVDPRWRVLRDELTAARRELATERDRVATIMTMRELPSQRETRVLDRGAYDAPGHSVLPGTPAAVGEVPNDLPRNRLGLAIWTTAPDHPLTARVAVNRLWATVFGRGLVVTPEDFGVQGSVPSHPDLLDTLAVDFVESGWDVKRLLRRLVLSSTFRQASLAAPEVLELDPENVLLARGPSRQLSAEMMRDQALAASGLLVRTVGGPSVFPYQPPGLWKEKSGAQYPMSTGEALYRRSLYTFWKRTSPPPSMMILDAAKRDVCVARRESTATPLQSLVVLNDPQFVEAAGALADRVRAEKPGSPADQIRLAFRLLTGVEADEGETAILTGLVEDLRVDFEADLGRARQLVGEGEDAASRAAMTAACSALFGYDGAMTTR